MEFWQEFSRSILSNLAEASVYLIIGVIFIIAIMKCIAPVGRSRTLLRKAARKLRRSEKSDVWQDKAFLGKRGPLSEAWAEYLNSRLFANDDYHNASPLEDYINEDTAIYTPGFVTLADSVPGIMVSLGFLGTLIGMVMGLADIDMTNADMTMTSISKLLAGMRYAFTTSIVGVIASISFSLTQRWVHSGTRRALIAFQDAMRTEAHVVTVDPMTQITIYQQEQTAQLQAIAEELTCRMADKMGAAVEKSLAPIRDSLDNFIAVTTSEQLRGLDTIVHRFVEHMDQELNGQFRNLAAAIDETCRWHRETQETVRGTIEGLNRVSRNIMEIQQLSESLVVKFDGYISRLGAAQQAADDSYGMMAAGFKNMELVARQQGGYIAQIGQLQADFMREVNSFQTRMDAFAKSYVDNTNLSTGALQKVAAELRQSGEAMKLSGEQLVSSHKTFTKSVNEELQHAFGMFDANMDDIIKQLTFVITSLRDSLADVPQTMGEASAQYADQMAQLIEYMKETEHMLDDALRRAGRSGGTM